MRAELISPNQRAGLTTSGHCPGRGAPQQSDSPTSTHFSRPYREGKRQRLWDIVTPEVIILNLPWERTVVYLRPEVRPADAGEVGAEGAYGRTGKESMTERMLVRGLASRPNGWGTGADLRDRLVPDGDPVSRQCGSSAFGWDHPESVRAHYQTAIGVDGFSVRPFPRLNNSRTTPRESFQTRQGRPGGDQRSRASRLTPIRRSSPAS